MNKKITAAVLAAAMLTACGAKDEAVPAANYIAVYEEATQPTEISEVSETIPEIEITPLTPENGFTYLQNTLFIGDGVCSIISESGLLPEEQVISFDGTFADELPDLSEQLSSPKPYIYLWFGDKSVADEKTPDEYGAAILALAENIRTVCPESMVLAMSYPPLPEEYGGKSDELNEMLHMYIRSTPDEYIIYRNFSYAAENADGYLAPEYGTEEINAAGVSAMLNAVEHDRFYSDMTSDSDGKYEDITASRPEYTVTDGKVAYLTFDDGPSKYTPQILDILRENDIKATFFITGWCIDGKEHILKQVADEGHTIALHSYSHDYDKIYASRRAWLDDFAKVYGKVYAVTGQKPWAFRFPGGSYNSYNRDTADGIIAEMQKRGFAYYDWNAATADASSSATYDSCMDYLQNSIGSDHEVVLMHDSLELTPQYLQDVIDYIKGEGYSFETIDAADEVHF